ncbi:desiccation-related protein PCC13-62-like, partial [Vitis riparia]|uniref:desiccation-related protein PCC13-62-like n=1 Tax=Vitis riparia TaxID=96939 RepID=UPI00155AFC66
YAQKNGYYFSSFFFILPFLLYSRLDIASSAPGCGPQVADDVDRIQFALNLEFLEAEFFLHGALGEGLDQVAPQLAHGGPPPIGARKANLDDVERRIIEEFGYQEVGHLRAITSAVEGLPRPPLDLSPQNFDNIFNQAIGQDLKPPMDPYSNTVNYLLASYAIPYVGLVGYVGTIPSLTNSSSLSLVASLLGVESGQDAVIRALLYKRECEFVEPYNITVAEFTRGISNLRNQLGMCGVKDEGVIVVDPQSGVENKTDSNILSADANSLSYARQPQEILRIVYGTGNESQPGGFLPKGGIGNIAQGYLNS